MNFKVSLSGVNEIDKVLQALPKELTHKVLSQAHFAAARSLVDREHLLAPVFRTGNLAASIGAEKTSPKNARIVGLVKVGPRRGGRYKGYAGHLNEYGTRPRKTMGKGRVKRGVNRGIMPSKPFAEPAFNQTKAQVEREIAVNIGKVLLRTMRRYIKG